MPEAYALTPTPTAARQAFAAGQLTVSPAAAQRRAALTQRARTRQQAPPPQEGQEMRLGSIIPDVQELLSRDWSEWWDIMSGGLTQQVPEGIEVREAILPGAAALIPAAGTALAGWAAALPAVATGAIGAAGLGALGAWGLGWLGGGDGVIPGTNIPLGGPFLAEPPAEMIAKEWNTGTAQFYQLIDGRIAVYSKKKKTWKAYRPAKHIVVSKNPRMGTLLRASSRIDKLWSGISKKAAKHLKKKVTYGIPPAKVLSAVERAAIRG